jgi:hypothetical protein
MKRDVYQNMGGGKTWVMYNRINDYVAAYEEDSDDHVSISLIERKPGTNAVLTLTLGPYHNQSKKIWPNSGI